MSKDKIKAEDYGDILALKYDGEKIYFSEEGGSYQGQYVAVIKTETELGWDYTKTPQYYVIVDDYGSCSGCDWLQAEGETDWEDDNRPTYYVDAKKALEYAEQTKPLYILPKKPTKVWVDNLAKKVNSL